MASSWGTFIGSTEEMNRMKIILQSPEIEVKKKIHKQKFYNLNVLKIPLLSLMQQNVKIKNIRKQ